MLLLFAGRKLRSPLSRTQSRPGQAARCRACESQHALEIRRYCAAVASVFRVWARCHDHPSPSGSKACHGPSPSHRVAGGGIFCILFFDLHILHILHIFCHIRDILQYSLTWHMLHIFLYILRLTGRLHIFYLFWVISWFCAYVFAYFVTYSAYFTYFSACSLHILCVLSAYFCAYSSFCAYFAYHLTNFFTYSAYFAAYSFAYYLHILLHIIYLSFCIFCICYIFCIFLY